LTQASIVTGVNFGIIQSPYGGGNITALDFGITSTPNSYPITSNASVTTGAQSGTGEDFWILRTDSFSTGNIALGPGTYYLVLQNAVNTGSEVDFWTDGLSIALLGVSQAELTFRTTFSEERDCRACVTGPLRHRRFRR
jgi:hypothetical protein